MALVACVENTVQKATVNATDSELIQACLESVQQRWRPVDESKGTIVRDTRIWKLARSCG